MRLRCAFFFCVRRRIRWRLQIVMMNLCLLTPELLRRTFHFRPCFCRSVSAVELYKVFWELFIILMGKMEAPLRVDPLYRFLQWLTIRLQICWCFQFFTNCLGCVEFFRCGCAAQTHDLLKPRDVVCPLALVAMSIFQSVTGKKAQLTESEFTSDGCKTPIT